MLEVMAGCFNYRTSSVQLTIIGLIIIGFLSCSGIITLWLLNIKGAVRKAIQVLKPYKCNKNIIWVYTITGRLRQKVNHHSHFLATSYSSLESINRVFNPY